MSKWAQFLGGIRVGLAIILPTSRANNLPISNGTSHPIFRQAKPLSTQIYMCILQEPSDEPRMAATGLNTEQAASTRVSCEEQSVGLEDGFEVPKDYMSDFLLRTPNWAGYAPSKDD